MRIWKVLEKKTIIKAINKAPAEILVRYETWKRIVELQGPVGLKLIKGFNDETLKGEWKGFRSSRLGKQWRVIYKIESDHLEVFVVEITPHDYRRKK